MQLTTTNGKDIYVNPNYIFKIESTQNGSLLSFEVEKFVLQDLQDIEVSQEPKDLTELINECFAVNLIDSEEVIYLNRKYVFKIVAAEGYTEIYISIKDIAQKYRIYKVANLVEGLISQIPLGGGASGYYLPLSGGTMLGSIYMSQNTINGVGYFDVDYINANVVNVADIYSQVVFTSYIYDDNGVTLDLNNHTVESAASLPLSYAGDYSTNYTERSIPDVAYVDAKTANVPKVFKLTFTTGVNNEGSISHYVTHDLNSLDIIYSLREGPYPVYEGLVINGQAFESKNASNNILQLNNLLENTEYRIIITAY